MKGKGPLVNPTSGSSEGGPAEDEVRENWNVLTINVGKKYEVLHPGQRLPQASSSSDAEGQEQFIITEVSAGVKEPLRPEDLGVSPHWVHVEDVGVVEHLGPLWYHLVP